MDVGEESAAARLARGKKMHWSHDIREMRTLSPLHMVLNGMLKQHKDFRALPTRAGASAGGPHRHLAELLRFLRAFQSLKLRIRSCCR